MTMKDVQAKEEDVEPERVNGFINWFTDDPENPNLEEHQTLIGVNSNPFQEEEYVVTVWMDKR